MDTMPEPITETVVPSVVRPSLFQRYKPRTTVKVQLILAAAMWTVAACILGFRAVGWLIGTPLALPLWVAALILGELKARYIMDRVATNAIVRIRKRGDARRALRDSCRSSRGCS